MAVAVAATSAAAVLAATGTSTAAPRAAAASGPKVCLVTDIGGLNDRGFNQLAYKGLKQAKAELGADIAVKQSAKDSDYVPNLQACGAQGYQLVIAVGFLMEKAVGQVAKQFPSTKFAIIDDSVKSQGIAGAKNVRGLLFKEQESGYLVGYLTGLLNKKGGGKFNGKGVASTVGGLSIPAVNRYIAGFRAGVKKADPSMKTPLNGYSNDFVAQDKCKQLAASRSAAAATWSSRSRVSAASAPCSQLRRRACGASASTPTSPTSARTCSPRRSSASTPRCS